MSKIFCIEFQAVKDRHTALVSIYKKEESPLYHIQFTDSYLKNIFLIEHLRYVEDEGYRKLDVYKNPFTRELLQKIAGSIHKAVSHQSAIIRWLFPSLKE